MLYMHCDEIIFGLDLKLLKFVGLNEDRVKNKIKEKSSVFLRDKEILIEYKNTIENIDGKIRYIPYLYSIKNEQNVFQLSVILKILSSYFRQNLIFLYRKR